MKVWIVNVDNADYSEIVGIYSSKYKAVKGLFKKRDELINEWLDKAKYCGRCGGYDNTKNFNSFNNNNFINNIRVLALSSNYI